jgi:hypothetical protein
VAIVGKEKGRERGGECGRKGRLAGWLAAATRSAAQRSLIQTATRGEVANRDEEAPPLRRLCGCCGGKAGRRRISDSDGDVSRSVSQSVSGRLAGRVALSSAAAAEGAN